MQNERSAELAAMTEGFEKSLCGTVTPPPDMHAAARQSLSPEGYERLMRATGGAAPTPAQLVQEAEFERTGAYPVAEPAVNAKAQAVARDAYMIAAAKSELSDEGFKTLMHSIDWRAPTAAEVAQAVDAERAAKH